MDTRLIQTRVLTCLIALAAFLFVVPAQAQVSEKTLTLGAAGPSSGPFGHTGQAGQVQIEASTNSTTLEVSVSGLTPNTVHTLWIGFETTQPPFAFDSAGNLIAVDPATGTTARVLAFTPGTAETSGFKAGNGLDPNGFITDSSGAAEFTIQLNYNIFSPAVGPVVLVPGTTQTVAVTVDANGNCVASSSGTFMSAVDSGYMRVFDTSTVPSPPNVSPSFQLTNGQLKPRLVRGNLNLLAVLEHFDGLTHGHRPGVPISMSKCGDHAARLTGLLSNAVSEN
jgi:hypothetical protein